MRLRDYHILNVAHEAHRALCEALDEPRVPAWDDAPAWMHANAMTNLRAAQETPGISPAQRHWKWVEEMKAKGWTLGPKNAEAKTHPCLMPFSALPEKQQMKGRLFGAIVEALLVR